MTDLKVTLKPPPAKFWLPGQKIPSNGKHEGNGNVPYQFSRVYDPALADQSIRLDLVLFEPRFWRVARALWTFTTATYFDQGQAEPDSAIASKKRRRTAKNLTNTLVELGATFIKLGQFLSVRRDFLPVEFADELSLLQDKVPPFDFELVRRTVERELGNLPEAVFDSFEPIPIASASIGQVHQAVLKNGRLVAVKVQRPNLARMLYQDLGYMRCFVRLAQKFGLKGDWQSWLELSDEFGRVLFCEIDYLKEGRNADRLRQALRDRPAILIPRVIWKYTGRRVLTLEYLSGIKIDNIAELSQSKVDLEKLGNQLVDCYMDQVLNHGFFQADPHSGNLSVTASGELIIYDFGMMGEISAQQKEAILGCIASVVDQDANRLASQLMALGAIRQSANLEPIVRALQPFIEYYSGKSVLDLDFSHLEKDIDQIATDRALRLPPNLAYLIRTAVALEGVARTLKVDFSFVEAVKPSLNKWVKSQPSQAAEIMKAIYRKRVRLLKATSPRLLETNAPMSGQSLALSEAPSSLVLSQLQSLQIRAVTLQAELAENRQNARKMVILLTCQLVFNLGVFFVNWALSYLNLSSYTNFFLIENCLMGALILWHLAKPLRLTNSASGQNQGTNGDMRC